MSASLPSDLYSHQTGIPYSHRRNTHILATLHAAATVAHVNQPKLRLHPLKGQMKGFWAVTVRANWRVIFRFDDGATDVDYVDYH